MCMYTYSKCTIFMYISNIHGLDVHFYLYSRAISFRISTARYISNIYTYILNLNVYNVTIYIDRACTYLLG